jgi:hypothetical protein
MCGCGNEDCGDQCRGYLAPNPPNLAKSAIANRPLRITTLSRLVDNYCAMGQDRLTNVIIYRMQMSQLRSQYDR